MTVKQFIEELQKYPMDAEVVVDEPKGIIIPFSAASIDDRFIKINKLRIY